ncbi:MAG TPA: thioredoxin [Gammaproteobacteria bacterium]|nr:thioredoxin [Gammaproteobacteria bacterium]
MGNTAESAHSVDITRENFSADVIEASESVPVVVDFWAPWCGPCQTLMPLLMRLAEEYAGAFRLAKVNIDEQPELATQFGVRSVPTVKVIRLGEVVDEFLGALPEAQIRDVLDRYVERTSDKLAADALAQIERGEVEAGLSALAAAADSDPENYRTRLALAEAQTQAGDYDGAAATLRALPADVATKPTVVNLQARLDFATVARSAPPQETLEAAVEADPDNSEARYQLAARRVLGGDYEAAMDQLLEILRRDRAYGDDAGRKGLLKVFELLGGKGELVNRYRGRMSAALY